MMPYTMVAFVEWFRSGMPFPPKQKLSIDDQIVFIKFGIAFLWRAVTPNFAFVLVRPVSQ